jgi:putative ABC transport system permease protein
MLRSYLTITLRLFSRHKFFSSINAIALALGMSVSLLLISFYSYISSFDDFHSQKENIYRVITTKESQGNKQVFASAPAALAPRLMNEASGIDNITRINSSFHSEVVSDKINIPIQGYYADDNFFSMFDFEMIRGNAQLALNKPRSIVLIESVAKKLSASDDLLGRVLEIKGLGDFEVTGIIKDPKQTHFLFEVLISFSSLTPDMQGEGSDHEQWTHFQDQYVYVLTNASFDEHKFQHSLNQISGDANRLSKQDRITFDLQSLGDITPGPDLENSIGPDSDYTLLVVFATMCVLILFPSCFNYANLSIAHALKRSKEIGLRKTLGGNRKQIFFQFITETVATVLIALVGAILIFMLIRSEFENMMPGGWLNLSLTWEMLVLFFVFALITGFLTGVLPALYFGKLNPIQALKATSHRSGRMNVRRFLIIGQFALSFCFIVLLIVFSRQYQHNLNFDYGFNTENIVNVELQDVDHTKFRSATSSMESVHNISMSSDVMGLSFSNTYVQEQRGGDSTKVYQLFCDANYISNMELQLIAGRNFPEPSSEERYILVNEEFLRARQITRAADALGKTYFVEGKELEVLGVLKDFHFAPITEPIKSFFLRMDTSKYMYANMKIVTRDLPGTMHTLESTWNPLSNRKIEAHLFDDKIEELFYKFYRALIKMIGFLGLIAISITLLGLLGMVMFTIEPRAKEVGIRKVFGANESTINFLLAKDFLKLMAWSGALGIMLSTLVIDNFLSMLQYYHINLGIGDLALSLAVFIFIGISTIAFQIRRVANANPVDTLRHE